MYEEAHLDDSRAAIRCAAMRTTRLLCARMIAGPGAAALSLALVACGGGDDAPVDLDAGIDAAATSWDSGPATGGGPYPEPGAWPANRGPGGPATTFTEEQLYQNCAFLDGGDNDPDDHHNLVQMVDGYLVMPYAPEYGMSGGLAFFDISDPCNPSRVGQGAAQHMRETHSLGFTFHGGAWAVTNMIDWDPVFFGGILFWDISDPSAAVEVAALPLPGFFYPDAYARPTLSVFWQAPYVYVAGADNGVYIVDATVPAAPRVVATVPIEPTLRAGQIQVIGNLMVVTGAESARAVLLDVSDPEAPQPIPGGDFLAADGDGNVREAYFSNVANGLVYFARKDSGGGLMIYDIRDPSTPTRVGGVDSNGNGGYVFVKDEFAFEGEGSFAGIYDVSDPAAITEVARLLLPGDLDTMTPIGNVVVLSVDDEADEDRGSAVAPWQLEPDTRAPRVTWSVPADGAMGVPRSSRVGVTLSEFVDPKSAWPGSVRLYPTGTDPATTRINGYVSAQESIVNFAPFEPLAPDTAYTLEIPAGGLSDYNGNAITEPFTLTFTTAGS